MSQCCPLIYELSQCFNLRIPEPYFPVRILILGVYLEGSLVFVSLLIAKGSFIFTKQMSNT